MRAAIGVTAIMAGAVAIWSGFKNVSIWDSIVATVSGS